MDVTARDYRKLAQNHLPKSPVLSNCLKAFGVGGGICTLGQLVVFAAQALGFDRDDASLLCTLTLVLISVLLTGLGVYDVIAKHAGAGTLVPVTGFANAMTSPAVEYKSEGLVTGLGVKMFSVAGPVIVYGAVASVVYGLVLAIIRTCV